MSNKCKSLAQVDTRSRIYIIYKFMDKFSQKIVKLD